ncbi:FAD-dependent urate hydroxylase HpxO [Kushneria indalinina]|uniref:FAD-dependent urate hydroxylase n=1 Tax=Kushneria indalinina DSM 14324 TaxID=1122140 RepID=A0A3D9DUZ1_9GAMM|nr:FAD-dependent urate hydroxylase HpxO [Kushneria indalinina]REC94610.1 FAD-dependent urate hydroxylase [Kushneria indalinina DSM 14324]
MNIVIIGAGMGGLTAALALQQQGHQVSVHDRVRELRPAGAALSIWSNGAKILHELGLGRSIEQASGNMEAMRYFNHDGALLTGFSLAPLYGAVGQPACPIARSELQRQLLAAVGHDNVHLGEHCVDFQTDANGVTVSFENGQTRRADLLIVADGTHSRLRDRVAGKTIERRYCGYVNWNVRVPAQDDLAPLDHWDQYIGRHQRVSLMPMGRGGNGEHQPEFYCFFDVPLPLEALDDSGDYRAELRHHFSGWAPEVMRLIERFDPALMARVPIHDIDPLDSLVAERVALLGDAAHAMAPDLGQGGCQAMEDAWVLAKALSEYSDLSGALNAYDQARVDRVSDIILRARKRADMTHGQDPAATDQWYQELAREDGRHIMAGMQKTIEGGPLA